MVPGDDSTRFFDEHGMRVVNAPPGMRFNQLEVVQTTFPPCEVACHAPSLNISFSPFYLPTTAAIGPGWDLRCLHGYASLKRRTVLFAAWHLVWLGWELGGNFPGFCIGSGASRSAGLAALIQVLDLLQNTNGP